MPNSGDVAKILVARGGQKRWHQEEPVALATVSLDLHEHFKTLDTSAIFTACYRWYCGQGDLAETATIRIASDTKDAANAFPDYVMRFWEVEILQMKNNLTI
jgi:hypothetical protein